MPEKYSRAVIKKFSGESYSEVAEFDIKGNKVTLTLDGKTLCAVELS